MEIDACTYVHITHTSGIITTYTQIDHQSCVHNQVEITAYPLQEQQLEDKRLPPP